MKQYHHCTCLKPYQKQEEVEGTGGRRADVVHQLRLKGLVLIVVKFVPGSPTIQHGQFIS